MIYQNQSNAWVNTEIFAHWFHTNFVPVVSKRLQEIGVEPKAVPLLDNCSAHPNEDELGKLLFQKHICDVNNCYDWRVETRNGRSKLIGVLLGN